MSRSSAAIAAGIGRFRRGVARIDPASTIFSTTPSTIIGARRGGLNAAKIMRTPAPVISSPQTCS